MTISNAADSAVGQRLRQAREAAGYSLAEVSARSHMPVRVLAALEAGDWATIGAPVFVRGQVRGYARALGLTLGDDALPSPLTTSQIPSLVSRAHVPRYRHVAENLVRRGVYVVLTVSLVVPVWLATRGHLDPGRPSVEPLDLPVVNAATATAPPERTPMVASLAPLAAPPSVSAELVLQLSGDSWVQLFAADGRVVERGLLRAGERRPLRAGEIARVVVGNVAAAQLTRGGEGVDLSPYSQANVARFTLSSDGSLAPFVPAGP